MLNFTNVESIEPVYTYPEGFALTCETYGEALMELYNIGKSHKATHRYAERILFLGAIADRHQAWLLSQAETTPTGQEEIDAVANEMRTVDVWAGREWTEECPLVVLAESYAGKDQIPTGNVIVMSADNEKSTIDSCYEAGLFDLQDIGEESDV